MKTPRRLVLAALTLLGTPALRAQSIATPGYLLTNQADTLRGYLDDEDWAVSPRSVVFRGTADGQPQRFEAAQVRGFVLTERNRRYVSRFVRIGYPIQDIAFNDPKKMRFDTLHVFLEVVLEGQQASLFELNDETERARYYVEKAGQLTELVYFKQYLSRNGQMLLAEEKAYSHQLAALCADAPQFSVPVPGYSRRNLADYLTRYNSCFAAATLRYDRRSERAFLFDVWLQGSAWVVLPNKEIDLGGIYSIGLGVRVNFPRHHHNRYATVLVERLGPLNVVSLNVGTHFGHQTFRPFYQMGVSTASEGYFTHFAVGLSYRRLVRIEALTRGFLIIPMDPEGGGLKFVKLSVGGAIPFRSFLRKKS